MGFKNRDILSIKDFSKEELLQIIATAAKIEQQGINSWLNLAKGSIMASAFFEPSTRTRLSFEASMQRLGGSVIGFSEQDNTSISKGETMQDTIKILDGYCDVVIMRHPESGSAAKAAEVASHPVINAGDGSNEHPTQTFVDLYTIMKVKKSLDNINIGFLGDLKYGRTVHSLAYALSHFKNKIYFISNESLRMPENNLKELESENADFTEVNDLSRVCKKLDILYVTRIQKERFLNIEDYKKVNGSNKLNKEILKLSKPGLKILHPLPRVDEIDTSLDKEK